MVPIPFATIAGGLVIAQGAPESPGDWLNYGVAGLVVISLLLGWLAPGRTLEREIARGDRLEAELRQRDEYISEKVVPALTRATDTILALASRGDDGVNGSRHGPT